MTDQMGRRARESFSSFELLSVVAMMLVIVMVAVPFPYARRDHWSPASRPTLGREFAVAETKAGETLKSSSEESTPSVGAASQRSPFEVRTVGHREFCADMPGVVRFTNTGGRCRNGSFLTNAQLHREQMRLRALAGSGNGAAGQSVR